MFFDEDLTDDRPPPKKPSINVRSLWEEVKAAPLRKQWDGEEENKQEPSPSSQPIPISPPKAVKGSKLLGNILNSATQRHAKAELAMVRQFQKETKSAGDSFRDVDAKISPLITDGYRNRLQQMEAFGTEDDEEEEETYRLLLMNGVMRGAARTAPQHAQSYTQQQEDRLPPPPLLLSLPEVEADRSSAPPVPPSVTEKKGPKYPPCTVEDIEGARGRCLARMTVKQK